MRFFFVALGSLFLNAVLGCDCDDKITPPKPVQIQVPTIQTQQVKVRSPQLRTCDNDDEREGYDHSDVRARNSEQLERAAAQRHQIARHSQNSADSAIEDAQDRVQSAHSYVKTWRGDQQNLPEINVHVRNPKIVQPQAPQIQKPRLPSDRPNAPVDGCHEDQPQVTPRRGGCSHDDQVQNSGDDHHQHTAHYTSSVTAGC